MGRRNILRYKYEPRGAGDKADDSHSDQGIEQRSFRYRIGKTTCVVIVWICLGLVHSVYGSTMPDLRDRLHTNMENLQLALGFRDFGALTGSLCGGMLADRYRHRGDLIMGVAVILTGFPEIIKPNTGSLVVLGILSFVGGLGQGAQEAVGHAIILWLWAEKASSPFHAIHMGYPIGSTLAPILAKPFLGPNSADYRNTTTYLVPPISPSTWNQSETYLMGLRLSDSASVVSRIEVPFGIIGGVTCLAGCFFIMLFFIGLPKGMKLHGEAKKSFCDVLSPKTCRGMGSTAYTCVILVLVCIMYMLLNGGFGTLTAFIFSYAVESEYKFTKSEAAVFDTVFRATEIVGRIIAVIISNWCPIQPLLMVEVICNTVCITCLAFLGTKHRTYLWVFACLYKFTAAPIWPAGMAWVSKYLKFSSMVVALTQIVNGVTGYFFSWLSGYLYDNYDKSSIIFFSLVCGYLVLVNLIIMQVVASCCARKDDEDVDDDEEKTTVVRKDTETTIL